MTSIESLRVELNRNRAYVRAVGVGIKLGSNVKQSTRIHLDIKNRDAAVIKQALRKLRNVKPVYTWMKRESEPKDLRDY